MRLNVVEACKLARNIENFKREICNYLVDESYLCTKKENHLRSKVSSDLADEVIDIEDTREYNLTVEDILVIVDSLMEKKARLSSAIEDAKHNISIEVNGHTLSYDSAIEYNKSLRDFVIYSMRILNRKKEGTSTRQNRGYKMDAEGKQTSYIYDVEVTTTFTFDKANAKKKEKEYRKLADEVSTKIDEAKLTNYIDIDIDIDTSDTLEDIINAYLTKKNS